MGSANNKNYVSSVVLREKKDIATPNLNSMHWENKQSRREKRNVHILTKKRKRFR